jgi:hypothetical protein
MGFYERFLKMWITAGKFRGRGLGVSSPDGNEKTTNKLPIPCLIGMVKTKLCHGEDKGENPPRRSPLYEKIGQEGLAQKIKTKNPKFTEEIEVRAYTLRCNVAWPQAAYPFHPQSE